MKIPEPLFKVINFVVASLLKSPLHRLASSSLMLISFTGRNSGKQFTTPIRYLVVDGKVRCFTSKSTGWWKNLVSNQGVTLTVAGSSDAFQAKVTIDDQDFLRDALKSFLLVFPQDAVYQNIRIDHGELNQRDLETALEQVVMMELTPEAA